jgi:hypothetical protein
MKCWILFVTSFALLSGPTLYAQDISGNWQGTLLATNRGPFAKLRIFLKIAKAESGDWKAAVYSVDQGGAPIPVTSITLENLALQFSIDPLHSHYSGRLNADNASITGAWTQGGSTHELDLRRAFTAQRITGEQLEHLLVAIKDKPDAKVAEQLSRMEVTERLNTAMLSRCETDLTGPRAKQALLALADKSAFLEPPASEILAIAKPEFEAQRKMIALASDYVAKAIRQLPNLFATRVTTHFQDNVWDNKGFLPAGTHSAEVIYRDGQEEVNSSGPQSLTTGMTTSGEFGPILLAAMLDAAQSNLAWSHWEQSAGAPTAVYRYAVDAGKSHYNVNGQFPAYRGEIAIDPVTGAILRLVMRADPPPSAPLLQADVLVDYGPVELGGKTYLCPLRSVALSLGLETGWLNDVVFDRYHLYTADTRILPGSGELH